MPSAEDRSFPRGAGRASPAGHGGRERPCAGARVQQVVVAVPPRPPSPARAADAVPAVPAALAHTAHTRNTGPKGVVRCACLTVMQWLIHLNYIKLIINFCFISFVNHLRCLFFSLCPSVGMSNSHPVRSTACRYLAGFAPAILIPTLLPVRRYCPCPGDFISILGAFVTPAQPQPGRTTPVLPPAPLPSATRAVGSPMSGER